MTRLLPVLLSAAVLVASACGDAGGAAEETASTSRRTTTLTMANPTVEPAELRAFADEVSRGSGGTLKVRFVDAWRAADTDRERKVIGDVAAGEVDLGWAGPRAFAALGIHAFDALTAPLVVDSYALEAKVLASDLPGTWLRHLTPLRRTLVPLYVEGLGILPGPLRYAASAKAPRTNVALSPRPFVIFAGKSALAKLTSDERDLLREAVRAAAPAALAISRARQRSALATRCARASGVSGRAADGRGAVHATVARVLADLRRDPQTRAALAAVERLRAGVRPESVACPRGEASA